MTTLYIAVPCYNEQEVLPETSARLIDKMQALIDGGKISYDSRVLFIDDGSNDKTWEIIQRLHSENRLAAGLKLSRNRGHQNALFGGLTVAGKYADAVISIDADLQDDINAIDLMLENFENGCDIVYGVRSKRDTDTFFKRVTAEGFYRFLKFMGAEVVFNHADYRLMSKRAIEELEGFGEVNLFLRGIVPMLGFKTAAVEYERAERLAGKSKYPLKKMLSLAWEGVTSLSIKPIRFITVLGAAVFIVSIIMLIYSLISHFIGNTTLGWTSLIVSIWAIGGLQLLAIGIIGEYLGKIYLETKRRPRFIIDKFLN